MKKGTNIYVSGLILALLFGFLKGNPKALASARTAILPRSTAGENQAAVIVEFAENDRSIRQASFSSSSISGLEALTQAGYDVTTKDYGGGFIAVCSIDQVGCPADDCFCSSNYWGYHYWDGSQWQDYSVGAAGSTVSNGGVEGWQWGVWGGEPLAAATPTLAAWQALSWLAAQQSAVDGGYGSMSSSLETLLAAGSDNLKAAEWIKQTGSPSLLDYMLASGSGYADDGAGQAGKLAVGLASSGETWANSWPNSATTPMDYFTCPTGKLSASAIAHAWGMLGSRALNQLVPFLEKRYLEGLQTGSGGWEWAPGYGEDSNTTAVAIQALVAAGEARDGGVITSGLDYLKSMQNTDGGFSYARNAWDTGSDANSTAYVIQAILTAGQKPEEWLKNGTSPLDYLLSLQQADGSFEWQSGAGSNLLATQQAIPALMRVYYPSEIYTPSGAYTQPECPSQYLPLVIH